MSKSPRLGDSRGPVRSGKRGAVFRGPVNALRLISLPSPHHCRRLDSFLDEADSRRGSAVSKRVSVMSEYRRGLSKGVRQKWWHYHEQCEEYPTRTFSIRNTRPPEDEVCSRCDELKHEHA